MNWTSRGSRSSDPEAPDPEQGWIIYRGGFKQEDAGRFQEREIKRREIMANLKLSHIYKVYDNGHKAVNDFSIDIADQEFIVFVGPSGCGKSTTLRMIAGLEDISDGTLTIGDRVVNDVEPKDRDIAMVFQNYALYPHLSVEENIVFPLKNLKGKAKMTKEIVEGLA